jgi:hypothetical protein
MTLPPEFTRATAMPINPCTGAPGATPHWTCIAANPPGHASPPGTHGTGGKRSLPAGRPVRPVYQSDQIRTREGYRGRRSRWRFGDRGPGVDSQRQGRCASSQRPRRTAASDPTCVSPKTMPRDAGQAARYVVAKQGLTSAVSHAPVWVDQPPGSLRRSSPPAHARPKPISNCARAAARSGRV